MNYNQSNPSTQNHTNLYTTKEKIKNFFEKAEDKKRSNIIKTPTYDYSSKASTRKSDICLTSDFFNQKQKNINSIESFKDFSLKQHEKKNKRTLSSDPFNIEKINETNTDFSITTYNKIQPENTITASSIRSIASKLSFSSNEDIQKMDKALATELINLSHLINRTFVPSSKKPYL